MVPDGLLLLGGRPLEEHVQLEPLEGVYPSR